MFSERSRTWPPLPSAAASPRSLPQAQELPLKFLDKGAASSGVGPHKVQNTIEFRDYGHRRGHAPPRLDGVCPLPRFGRWRQNFRFVSALDLACSQGFLTTQPMKCHRTGFLAGWIKENEATGRSRHFISCCGHCSEMLAEAFP
jgi:hypothetical protein